MWYLFQPVSVRALLRRRPRGGVTEPSMVEHLRRLYYPASVHAAALSRTAHVPEDTDPDAMPFGTASSGTRGRPRVVPLQVKRVEPAAQTIFDAFYADARLIARDRIRCVWLSVEITAHRIRLCGAAAA